MQSVSTEEYWSNHWKETVFEIAPRNHPIRLWIEKEIPDTITANCMEIGCYPGKFLAVFGEKGYELNGVDSFHGTDSLSGWFKSRGYRYNHFYEADIFDFKSQIKYDLVCSFGFIEHFNDLEEVLDKHLELLKPGGKIIIDVPNLNSPIYYFLYKLFEPDVLKNHVLSSMNLKAITSVMIAKGCRIDYSGYVGRFYFRFVTKQGVTRRCISKVINLFSLLLSLLPDSLYKRYIGVIATKVS